MISLPYPLDERRPESNALHDPSDNLEITLDQALDQALDRTLDQTLDRTLDQTLDRTLDQTSELDHGILARHGPGTRPGTDEKQESGDLVGRENIKDFLKCSICLDIYCEPITLMCQHNFCKQCLTRFLARHRSTQDDDYVTITPNTNLCPLCKLHIFIPPQHNIELDHVAKTLFPDQYNDKKKRIIEEEFYKSIDAKVREDIWREVVNTITSHDISRALHDPIPDHDISRALYNQHNNWVELDDYPAPYNQHNDLMPRNNDLRVVHNNKVTFWEKFLYNVVYEISYDKIEKMTRLFVLISMGLTFCAYRNYILDLMARK
jgi:hypothetical protein